LIVLTKLAMAKFFQDKFDMAEFIIIFDKFDYGSLMAK